MSILHNFDGTDGDSPQGNLIKVGSYLYGMTYYGGINDDGTIFKIDENGTYYSVIYNFDQTQSTSGAEPNGTLIYNSPYLYGVTEKGGSNNKGVIFYVNTDGTGFNNLYSFGGSDDAIFPCGALVHYGDILFGMTKNSQTSGYYGTIYQISTTGTGYSMMHTFTGGSDGASPYGSLTLYGTDLYGMTNYGGANSDGTIFKIAADGSSPDYGYQLKHSFSGGNDGGNNPYGSLLVYSGFLYGMTLRGGYYSSAEGDLGIIFKMSPGSSGISIIHRFSEDGNQSYSDFVSDGTKLFGMTYGGGFNGVGTVFSMNPDGSDYNVLHEFAGGNDGTNPKEGLLLYNNVLYGTTQQGGTGNNGTIFKINKDGSGYSILYSFAASGDGQNPIGSLIVVNDGLNDILYGMTQGGDPGIYGTIFQYNIGTSLYNNIYNFVNDTKGGIPYGNLIFYNDYLYGTTSDATGNTTSGTIFKAKKDGTTLDVLHYFGYIADDGLSPTCGMILDNGTLYGTTM